MYFFRNSVSRNYIGHILYLWSHIVFVIITYCICYHGHIWNFYLWYPTQLIQTQLSTSDMSELGGDRFCILYQKLVTNPVQICVGVGEHCLLCSEFYIYSFILQKKYIIKVHSQHTFKHHHSTLHLKPWIINIYLHVSDARE